MKKYALVWVDMDKNTGLLELVTCLSYIAMKYNGYRRCRNNGEIRTTIIMMAPYKFRKFEYLGYKFLKGIISLKFSVLNGEIDIIGEDLAGKRRAQQVILSVTGLFVMSVDELWTSE